MITRNVHFRPEDWALLDEKIKRALEELKQRETSGDEESESPADRE